MTAGGDANLDLSPKKKGWPKGKKRRVLAKDVNAPKPPLSGYMLFVGDQREIMGDAIKGLSFSELNKLIAQKWNNLCTTEKQKYQEIAEIEKEKYIKELEEYQKTDMYKNYMKKVSEAMEEGQQCKKVPKMMTAVSEEESFVEESSPYEISIFTESFLLHNRARETELRQLKKSNIEYEEQNAILQKHIEGMRGAISKMESELNVQKENQRLLHEHIDNINNTLVSAFQSLPLPGSKLTCTKDNLDTYLQQLTNLVVNSSQQNQKLTQNVRTIMNQHVIT